ncbi:DUF441 domain-containing protein [Enterococcus faecalis]
MEKYFFILLIALISMVSKNKSLLIASLVILACMVLPYSSKILPLLGKHGMNLGITIISITILVPIATGEIGLKELLTNFKSPLGLFAIVCGIAVAILSAKGTALISASPEVTVALVLGTIVGVVFFKGLAAGPIIAAGITYYIVQLFQHIIR